MNKTDLFSCMVSEAIEELSKHGWRDSPQNAVTLASFGLIADKVEKKVDKLVKPAWAIASSFIVGVLWWIISSVVGV